MIFSYLKQLGRGLLRRQLLDLEFVILKKFAKFRHYTPNNKKVTMGGGGVGGTKVLPPSGCDKPKKPGLDRGKRGGDISKSGHAYCTKN